MKRFIPTIVLLVVLIGAFWYASSQSFFKKEEEEPVSKPLVTMKQEDIAGFKLKEEGLEFEKKDGKWTMVKPAAMPVETSTVESWLGSFTALKHDGEVEANPSDLSVFGLSSPTKEFEVTLNDGTVKTVQIGSPLPIAGHFYTKLKDSPAIYKLADQQITTLQKDLMSFMNKSPFKLNYLDVVGVELQWKGAKKSVVKTDKTKSFNESAWTLDGKEVKAGDVEPAIDKLLFAVTDQLVRPASELKLDTAELKLEIKFSKEGKESSDVYAGKLDNGLVWIVKQGDSWAYALAETDVQVIFDAYKKTEAK
ncbi:DUF4340 domain-containing protein [Paenibacillus oceani]|uniref:DUF4340 domain-containing protein n=1 Tax=Paenibacillus oceani TaxID=2772510 RepID=A0A927H0H7_9BACL|nr:DUF4340 domain-containing protein [Paenibacillus oceani]MBD2863690.1 DUF4340 domain-containing protein [Paenibacillus oceani]